MEILRLFFSSHNFLLALFLACLVFSLATQAAPQAAGPPTALPPLASNGVVRKYFANASEVTMAPDGYQRNGVIAVKAGQTAAQGPTIEVHEGDVIAYKLTNSLPSGTAVHFHGFRQRGNGQNDGVPSVTQCAMPPNQTNEYLIETAGQHGTFWYHSHATTQYVDGLRGPVIIHANPEPNGHLYDAEFVVTITDWYHSPSAGLSDRYLLGFSHGVEPVGASVLFNGIGHYDCGEVERVPGVVCNTPTTVPSFKFNPGKRYRIRIINMSAFVAFTFRIAHHKMTIIEADGEDLKPYEVGVLGINIAQRYSVVVTADQPFGNYTMYADYLCGHRDLFLKVRGEAVVEYTNETLTPDVSPSGVPSLLLPMTSAPLSSLPNETMPLSANFTCAMLDTQPLELLTPVPPPEIGWSALNNITSLADQRAFLSANPNVTSLYFTLNFNIESTGTNDEEPLPLINGVQYQPWDRSPLEQVGRAALLGNGLQAALALPSSTNAYVIPNSCNSVTMILNNQDTGEHPFHLHGHDFLYMGFGNGTFDASRDVASLNFSPTVLRRDTITIQPMGWVVLRFPSDNPGVWIFHCHIEWHLVPGLALIFVEHPEQLGPFVDKLPPDLQGICIVTPAVAPVSASGIGVASNGSLLNLAHP